MRSYATKSVREGSTPPARLRIGAAAAAGSLIGMFLLPVADRVVPNGAVAILAMACAFLTGLLFGGVSWSTLAAKLRGRARSEV